MMTGLSGLQTLSTRGLSVECLALSKCTGATDLQHDLSPNDLLEHCFASGNSRCRRGQHGIERALVHCAVKGGITIGHVCGINLESHHSLPHLRSMRLVAIWEWVTAATLLIRAHPPHTYRFIHEPVGQPHGGSFGCHFGNSAECCVWRTPRG